MQHVNISILYLYAIYEDWIELNWIEFNLIYLKDAAYKSTSGAIQRTN